MTHAIIGLQLWK